MSYSRTKVLTNEIYAPTNPSSEADARSQLDGAIQEVYDMLAAVAAGASGADYINSAPIAGVTGTTLYEMLSNIYAQLIAVALGAVPDGSITDAKLDNTDGAIKDIVNTHIKNDDHIYWGGTTTGPVNTYACTIPEVESYFNGLAVCIEININATGASTLNVNGYGAIPLLKPNSNNYTNSRGGGIYTYRYKSGNFILQGEDASGNAEASHLLSGKTATTDVGPIAGTMPNRAGDTAALSSSVSGTTLQLIPSDGYRDGVDDKVTITDANFVVENLIGTVFGKVGTGKRIATGTEILSSGGQFSISGLAFTPSIICGYGSSAGDDVVMCVTKDAHTGYSGTDVHGVVTYTGAGDCNGSVVETADISSWNTTITFETGSALGSLTIYWTAIE